MTEDLTGICFEDPLTYWTRWKHERPVPIPERSHE